MPRTLSTNAIRLIFDFERADGWLIFLTITHADIDPPIRAVCNTENVISAGNTYIGYPFRFSFGATVEGEQPEARLQIDNVDRTIVEAVRAVTGSTPPQVNVFAATIDDPHTAELGPFAMDLLDVSYDALVVEGRLSQENYLSEPYPSGRRVPGTHPGLFG